MACAEDHRALLVSEDEALVSAAIFFGIDARIASKGA